MVYLKLFWSFFQVGLFSFGGGYAALPLIEEQVIHQNNWLSSTEFIDIITISQMTPGPIAINTSTFVGTKVAGIPGSVVATLGCIAPSCIIVILLAKLYYKYKGIPLMDGILKGLRPAVVALIASAGLTIFLTAMFGADSFPIAFGNLNWISVFLFIIGLVLLRKTKLGPIHVMILSGIAGILIYYVIL